MSTYLKRWQSATEKCKLLRDHARIIETPPEVDSIAAEARRSAACCDLVSSVTRSRGEVRLKVMGSSMLPAVWPGDEITVTRCEYAALREGQIILYRRGSGLTAHRIEHITQDYLCTRGDSLLSSDPPVLPDEIVGRVTSILRRGRNVQSEPSPESRFLSLVLRHSNFSKRVMLYLSRCQSRSLQCFEEMRAS